MTNTLSTSKFVAALVGVAMVFSFAFALPAKANSDDIATQIQSLLATIAGLQAQLNALQGGSTTTGGTTGLSGVTFTQNHKKGDSGGQVMDIQKFLNSDPATQVATTGAGSPGNESSYFGSLTKAAVSKFQAKYASDILAPVGLTAPTGYWGPSSIAKANQMNASAGTGTGTVTTPAPTGTGVTVSAAAQPGNSLAPTNAANVPFTRFTVTNNSGSNATVDSVTVELGGLADKAAFSSVVLLDENGNQLGNTRTLNSNKQAKIGEKVTLAPGASKTFTVAGNIGTVSTTYAGQVASFSVVALNTTATVNGTLPITGAQHTLNGSLNIGTADPSSGALNPSTTASKEVGTTGYTFSSLKITAGSNEKIRVNSIRWNQSGSAATSDLANVVVVVDGTEYPTTVSADGKYYMSTFGSGLVINKGAFKEFSVKGDIVSGTNRTVAFDIYKTTDINVTGETYGYGITPSTSGSGMSSTSPVFNAAGVVTITGGTFNSVSKSNSAPAANIAEQKADEILGGFSVDIKGEPITVGTMNMDITVDAGVTTRNITNVILVDQDGKVLAGPVDSSTSLGTATTEADALTFSSVEFPVGVTTMFVKGQLDSDWAGDDTLAVSFQPSTDWSDVTGNNTGDTVSLPTATATGNTMTVKAVTLTVTTLTHPAARNIVKGVQDFIFAEVAFSATGSGEDVRVSAIGITDTPAVSGVASNIDNTELWANLSGGNTADYDRNGDGTADDVYETRIATAEQFDETATSTADTLSFTLDSTFEVKKNETVEVAVVADISGSAVTSATHTVKVSSVTAAGITSGTDTGSTPSGTGQAMVIKTAGTLVTSKDNSSPSYKMVVAGTADTTLGVLRFTGTNEAMTLKQVALQLETASSSASDLVSVELWDGSDVVASGFFAGSATTTLLTLTKDVSVPADGYKILTIKGDLSKVGTGEAGSQGAFIKVNHDTDDQAGATQALGAASGTTVSDTSSTDTSVAGVRMFRGIPTVAIVDVPSTTLTNGTMDLFRFSVSAPAGSNGIGLDEITLNFATSTASTVSGTTTVDTVKVYAYTDSGFSTPVSSHTNGLLKSVGTPTAGDNAVSFGTTELNIPAGQTYYIKVIGDVTMTAGTGTFSGYVKTKLAGDAGGFNSLTTKVDTVSGVNTQTYNDFIWSGHATTDSESTDSDWYNGYGVEGLPSDYTSATTISK